MSGGYFDYAQYRIGDIVESIQELIDTNHSKELDDWGSQIGREFAPVVIAEFENAINYLKLAQIYAHRIDWLVSGDDGEESFLKRLEDDLAENTLEMMAAAKQKTNCQSILDSSEIKQTAGLCRGCYDSDYEHGSHCPRSTRAKTSSQGSFDNSEVRS